MQKTEVKLSNPQVETLDAVITNGKSPVDSYNMRTLRALEGKGLVKLVEQKKGTFVSPTAKGKKALN